MLVTLQKLLKSLINWFSHQSKQTLEEKIQRDFLGPGVRLHRLNRRTARAVCTWIAIYPDLGYNIELGLDTLSHIDGVTPYKRQNRLATHAINIVRVQYQTVIVCTDNGCTRRTQRDVLLSEEAILELTYAPSLVNEARNILDLVAALLAAARVAGDYWLSYYPGIDLREKRNAEIAIALRLTTAQIEAAFPGTRLSTRALIEDLLNNPDIPKSLLYPPDEVNWKALFTMAARHRLASRTHVVFPDSPYLEKETVKQPEDWL